MSLLATGSIAIDSVTTPYGVAQDVLGGSVVYFSLAASLFVPVRVVAVVGEDFPPSHREVFKGRPIDLTGLEVRPGSRTFRWCGKYEGAMNEAETVRADLNVLAERGPRVPPGFVDSKVVFLANTHPALQRELLAQVAAPELSVCDTMNLWIEQERDELLQTLARVDGLVLNEGEARMLSGVSDLLSAGRKILTLGPRFVVIKKGEHGGILVTPERIVVAPAFPTDAVRDPTGAGDSFAGGMMGYLAAHGRYDDQTLARALTRGTIMASFTIEAFSMDRLRNVTPADVDRRLSSYLEMLDVLK